MKRPRIKLSLKQPFRNSQSVFQPPGTIAYVGQERTEKVYLESIHYNKTVFRKSEGILHEPLEKDTVNWFNVDGIHDATVLEMIGQKFDLHHLLLEDIANTTQRPKTEFYPDYIFQCIKMLHYDSTKNELLQEQVSIVLSKDAVVTFQEKTGDVFENVRDRIENSKGRIRSLKNDYLFYALIDSILDHYFIVVEKVGDYLDQLEDEIFEDPDKDSLDKAQRNKRLLLELRRAVYPLRECISRLLKENSSFINPKTHAYLHDAYDHCIQIIETVESYREINAGLKDMYLSSVSHKMNQVMQVLTVISSLFIPMTFVAGVYGMNFEHIPELTWEHGYHYFWIINISIFILLLIFFRWKKWI